VFHQYTITLRHAQGDKNWRDDLRKQLAERNIPSMVYYPIELHKQKAFEQFNTNNDQFPVSEMLCKNVLSLPIHTEMNKKMVEFICNNLLEIINIIN
jgi:dTDP-4-amino-4,6-dideoxygalactose transaminase